MKTLIDEINVKLQLDEVNKVIELLFSGKVETSDYQFAYNHLLTYAELEEISSFIINEKNGDIPTEAKAWRLGVFFPKLVAKIGRELNLVFISESGSKRSLSLKTFEKMLEKISKRLKLTFSQNEESARKFLIDKRKNG
ncbi:hypothetical protein [Sediminitomix flava]|uniref:Uncharacterized protein n=1 Tax=Sediminitomix flava TaxID=379075 RepID=A0A315Z7A4_SEDFL|nr:hypothetical protein [Sediminitomix flava]PWJ38491.1 hypothetical protein BC781_10781 [Sediminitomix flava]